MRLSGKESNTQRKQQCWEGGWGGERVLFSIHQGSFCVECPSQRKCTLKKYSHSILPFLTYIFLLRILDYHILTLKFTTSIKKQLSTLTERDHRVPSLSQEVFVLDGCWGKIVSFLSQVCVLLQIANTAVDGSTPITL